MQRHQDLFDFLRLLAAALVFWSHQHALIGLPEPRVAMLHTSAGGFGVFMFFAISGYLNAKSLLHRQQVAPFLAARFFRIYPAAIVCTVVCLVMGAFITRFDLGTYVTDRSFARFAITNATLISGSIHFQLPGVFKHNPVMDAVSGPVWTLPYEIACYVMFGLLAAALRYNRRLLAVALALPFLLVAFDLDPAWYARWVPMFTWSTITGLFAIFSLGALMAVVEDRWTRSASNSAAILVIAPLLVTGNSILAGYAALAAASIVVGRQVAPRLLTFRHDISYGLYIYAFPVQQLAISFTADFWLSTAIAVPLTLAMAYASCRLIEMPALQIKAMIYRDGIGSLLPRWGGTGRRSLQSPPRNGEQLQPTPLASGP